MNAEECKCTKLQSKQMGDKESLSKKKHMFSQLHWDFFVRKVQLLEESRKLKCLIENEAGEIKFLHLLTRIDLKGIRDVCIFLRDSSERKVTQSDFWSFLWSWAWIAKVSKLFWEHTVFENHSKKSQVTNLNCWQFKISIRRNFKSHFVSLGIMRHFLVILAHCDLGVCKYVLLLDGK